MIVITSSPVLAPSGGALIDARNPRIGYRNLVEFDNVFADQQTEAEPVMNVANPSTYLLWRGISTDAQTVVLSLAVAAPVNYFALARHNFGSTGAAFSFEYSVNGTDWTEITAPQIPNDDSALIVEFDSVTAGFFRLVIAPGTAPPAIGIWYVGEILILQRRIYVGHTPLVYGRSSSVSSGRSENGQFLGRMLRSETLESAVDMHNLTPDWYRSELDLFFQAARTTAFFFAWRPGDYPFEVGFAWLTGDPQVSNQRANGMVQVNFSMSGVR